jgi:hypothetical protein
MLTGNGSVGNTTTLNKVYDELLLQEWKVVHEKKMLEAPEEKDFSSVLSKEGRRIAFYTRGGYATFVIGAMDIYACVDIRLVQEPGWFSNKSCKMPCILPFLSGCCSETEVSEQLY